MKTILAILLTAATMMAQDTAKDLAAAKAKLERAQKRSTAAAKKASDAEAELRKLQGRIELTPAEALEMSKMYNAWQAEVIQSSVTLPMALKKSSDNVQRLGQQYKARLDALKAGSNATECEGLDADQKWAGCKAAAAEAK